MYFAIVVCCLNFSGYLVSQQMSQQMFTLCTQSFLIITGLFSPVFPVSPPGWMWVFSGPFDIKESHETSELSCDLLNLTGFISDPT